MRIDGAIFDLDGTLLDSMWIWDTLGEDYLRSRGLEPHEALNETFKTMSLAQAARYYQTEYGLSDDVDAIIAGIASMVRHSYANDVLPKPGVPAMLARFKERNIKMCIATATEHSLAEIALAHHGLLSYFDGIFTCGEICSGKDEPALFLAAHRFLQTPKETTWVFEDSLFAAQTAKHAGFPVAGVFDPSAADPAALRAIADMYLESFEQWEEPLC